MPDSSTEHAEQFGNTSNLEIVSSSKIGGEKEQEKDTVVISGNKVNDVDVEDEEPGEERQSQL